MKTDTSERMEKIRSARFVPYLPNMGPRFTLTLWDTYQRGADGKSRLAYRLNRHENGTTTTIFSGADFCCSPCHCVDSDCTIESIMGFLTLRPGDTDSEYFDDYTPAQLEFCENDAEALYCVVDSRYNDENGNPKRDH